VKLGNGGVFDAAVTGGEPELPNSLRLASVFQLFKSIAAFYGIRNFVSLITKCHHWFVTKPEAAQ